MSRVTRDFSLDPATVALIGQLGRRLKVKNTQVVEIAVQTLKEVLDQHG